MPLARMWTTINSIREIPAPIREAETYEGFDWWVDKAMITDDGMFIGLWFDHEAPDNSHVWKVVNGKWRLWNVAKRGHVIPVNQQH